MKLKSFQYSVLKYRPSYFLGEEVNVGLLFLFLDEQRTVFLYPNKLARLTSFYPDANLKTIRTYLKGFEQLASTVNSSDLRDHSGLSKAFLSTFLLEDASNLHFSVVKKGNHQSVEDTLEYYREAYFSVYDSTKEHERKDEKYLNDRFSKELERYQTSRSLFKKGVVLKNELQQTTFDFGWKNGTVNLVKSISFDLKDKDRIQNKSFRWFGELTKLSHKAEKDNLSFDLLVAKPRSNEMFSAYDKALQILDDIKAPKNVVEEEKLEAYVAKASQTVKQYQW